MFLFKTIFFITSLCLCLIISFLLVFISKSNHELKKDVAFPIKISLVSIICYLIFYFCDNYYWALFFSTIYFCCIEWLIYSMLIFISKFTNFTIKEFVRKIFYLVCLADSVSLFFNIFTTHSFDLSLSYFGDNNPYWSIQSSFFHYVHLIVCYFFVGFSFVMLIMSAIKEPFFYKRKYIIVFIGYFFVVAVNYLCYSLKIPIDFSVISYTILSGLIYYFSLYSFSNQLINHFLETVNNKIDDGIVFFNANGKYLYANNVVKTIIFNENGKFSPKFAEHYLNNWINLQKDFESKNNDSFTLADCEHHYLIKYQVLYSNEIKIGSFFKFIDRTEEINQYRKERYLSTHDELTGLYNQIGFFDAVENIQKHIQLKEKCTFIMLTTNIKDFKFVNEIFGEKLGDEILIKQAESMKKYTSIDSVLGRISDDKFAMFIKKKFFDEKIIKERIKELCNEFGINSYKLHFEIGYYESRYVGESPHIMCDKAMMACGQLSNDYQNIFSKYDSNLMDKVLFEKNIVSEFEKALKNNQFQIYIQPQIAKYGTNEEVYFGAEVFSRWIHPNKGILYPDSFIYVLEKTGLIYKLDKFIWEEVAKKIKEWETCGLKNTRVSVNVSLKDQYYIDIYKTFVELVKKYQINPNQLNIEVSETGFMENFEKSKKLFDDLKSYGFKVVIDDFGSGVSSLNMLKDINVDVLKIDQVFLREKSEDDRNFIILKSVIDMAKALNIEVLMEGVETKEDTDLLTSFGCNTFQGSFFSKPLPLEEFERLYL